MNLIDLKTGEKIDGIIEIINSKDIKKYKKHKNFTFDWSSEAENQTFKIRLEKSKEVIGLMSLIDYPTEFRIHINLIESSKIQRGKNKTISNIPACLIAYACKLAFKNGYEGFVSLTPKTQLINYYKKEYGFLEFGNQMAVLEEISESLIQKYLGDEEV